MNNELRRMHGVPTFKKRFTNEMPKLLCIYENPKIEYSKDIIRLEIQYSGINILLEFKDRYPFRPPNVVLNSIPYLTYLQFKTEDQKCMCCVSKMCMKNSHTSHSIPLILNEIYTNIKMKQLKTYLLLINVIKNKYLIQDIPLENWI